MFGGSQRISDRHITITFNATGLSNATLRKARLNTAEIRNHITACVVKGEIVDFFQKIFRLQANGNLHLINDKGKGYPNIFQEIVNWETDSCREMIEGLLPRMLLRRISSTQLDASAKRFYQTACAFPPLRRHFISSAVRCLFG